VSVLAGVHPVREAVAAGRSLDRVLIARGAGTAVTHLEFDSNNSLDITWRKVAFATAEVDETDHTVTVAVEATPIYDTTNGIITAVAKCKVDAICQIQSASMAATKSNANRRGITSLQLSPGTLTS